MRPWRIADVLGATVLGATGVIADAKPGPITGPGSVLRVVVTLVLAKVTLVLSAVF